jgi:aspartyl-tRNA(Asn)/glutamyl-tRNA(Gln) amidotransferase subunit A
MRTLAQLADDLEDGRTTSEALVEECLERIADPEGEGGRIYLAVDADGAREAARAMDGLRRAHAEPSRYAGVPVSVKDLFDVRGQVTRAGSLALERQPATKDAPAVARWRRAGLVVLGRTNMTEFAFSGVGLNPHHGTPANPWDRQHRRLPGGSSSGAAVSVADGMAHGALGTDTGGSCRIPAALCGLVGFKPTQARVSREGTVPLSPTLDTVGVIGRTVDCCETLYALLTNDEQIIASPGRRRRPPRLAAPRNYFHDDAEPAVVTAFDRTVEQLRNAGAEIVDTELPELDSLKAINAGGGFPAAEAFAWHQKLIAEREADYDPRVLVRIKRGERQTAADLLALIEQRGAFIQSVGSRLESFDAFICPTVPLVAPPIDTLDRDDEYTRVNMLMLRNPTAVNLLDGCAISIPMHDEGEPPTGVTVAALADRDQEVLRIAKWIEAQP